VLLNEGECLAGIRHRRTESRRGQIEGK
jgi:hypothetical protein